MNTTAADLTAAIASADMDQLGSVVLAQLGEGWTLKRQSEWVFWLEFGALRTPRGVYAGPRIRVTFEETAEINVHEFVGSGLLEATTIFRGSPEVQLPRVLRFLLGLAA